jgi:hypothetical protein
MNSPLVNHKMGITQSDFVVGGQARALRGRRFSMGRSAYWLHRIVAGKLQSLCSE